MRCKIALRFGFSLFMPSSKMGSPALSVPMTCYNRDDFDRYCVTGFPHFYEKIILMRKRRIVQNQFFLGFFRRASSVERVGEHSRSEQVCVSLHIFSFFQ